MAKGSIINKTFIWKTIRKKFLKKSKTSAKKYLNQNIIDKNISPMSQKYKTFIIFNTGNLRLTTIHQYLEINLAL